MKIWLKPTSEENVQMKRSVAQIDGELIVIHDDYRFYKVNIKKKLEERGIKR